MICGQNALIRFPHFKLLESIVLYSLCCLIKCENHNAKIFLATLILNSCWPELELYPFENIRTIVLYGCQMNLWRSYNLQFISSFPAAAPQESFVLPMLSSNEARRGKPKRWAEYTGSNHMLFCCCLWAFLPLSVLSLPIFMTVSFFPSFSSLMKVSLGEIMPTCAPTYEKTKHAIITIFITWCPNAAF